MSFETREFRNALGLFATGVTVVTSPQGQDVHGMTANAFSSLSLEPPLVLVCVDKRARSHDIIPSAGCFGITFLAADQQDVSNHFAGKFSQAVADRLQYTWVDGVPVLNGGLGYLACSLWGAHAAGDHTLFIGQVRSLSVGAGEPLLFFRGGYRRIAPGS